MLLPSDYKALLEAHPFPPKSYAWNYLLVGDADLLISLARVRDVLPPHSFLIGADGGESLYFIDLSRDMSPVFEFDGETRKVTEKSPDLLAFVEKCREMAAESLRKAIEANNRRGPTKR